MNTKDWENEVRGMTDKDRKAMKRAIDALQTWDVFEKEFNFTGIFTISAILKQAESLKNINAYYRFTKKQICKIDLESLRLAHGMEWVRELLKYGSHQYGLVFYNLKKSKLQLIMERGKNETIKS